jgi:hypothetical protein
MSLAERDAEELIGLNTAGAYLAPFFGLPGLFIFYVMSSRLSSAVVPFVVFWVGAVAVPTTFQLFYLVDPTMLSTPQLRVLTFLKSAENQLSTIRVGLALTIVAVVVSVAARLMPYPETWPLGGHVHGGLPRPYSALIFPTLFGALGSYIFHTGVALMRIRRNRARIQESSPPFPQRLIPRAFYLGSRRRLHVKPADGPLDGLADAHPGFVTRAMSAPLSARQVCSILAWMAGVPLLYSALMAVTLDSLREGPDTRTLLLLGLATAGLSLLVLGLRLWRAR